MLVDGANTFTISHTFIDVTRVGGRLDYSGEEQIFFGVPWQIKVYSQDITSFANVYLHCQKQGGGNDWLIDSTIRTTISNDNEEKNKEGRKVFTRTEHSFQIDYEHEDKRPIVGNLSVECRVTIHRMNGMGAIGK